MYHDFYSVRIDNGMSTKYSSVAIGSVVGRVGSVGPQGAQGVPGPQGVPGDLLLPYVFGEGIEFVGSGVVVSGYDRNGADARVLLGQLVVGSVLAVFSDTSDSYAYFQVLSVSVVAGEFRYVVSPLSAAGVFDVGSDVSLSFGLFGAQGMTGNTGPQGYQGASSVRADGSVKPAHLSNAAAVNDSWYYSTTSNKLTYKDPLGVLRTFY